MTKNKTTWNYRVIKMPDQMKFKSDTQTYSWGIYSVYYTKDKPTSWSENPMFAIGENWNELCEDYHRMFQAFTQPTLEVRGNKLVDIGTFN